MPFLNALPEKMSEKLGAITALIPISASARGGMLAARSAAEIVTGDQDRRAGIARIVEDIARLGAHRLRTRPAPAPRAWWS